MYKDVGKRILAVMLCICMLVGMGTVSNLTSRAEEAGTQGSAGDNADQEGSGDVTGTTPGAENLTVTYDKGANYRTYNGEGFFPVITVADGENTIDETNYMVAINKSDGTEILKDVSGKDILDHGDLPVNMGKYKVEITANGKTGGFDYEIGARNLITLLNNETVKVEFGTVRVSDTNTVAVQNLITLTDTELNEKLIGMMESDYSASPDESCDFICKITSGDVTKAGSVIKFQIVGVNNYGFRNASKSYEVTVQPKVFGNVEWENEIVYTSDLVVEAPKVYAEDDTLLKEGTDYNVEYYQLDVEGEVFSTIKLADIKTAGKYGFVISGRGKYQGTKSERYSFKIIKNIEDYISDITILGLDNKYYYSGESIEPNVDIKDGKSYVHESYYDVEILEGNNIEAGEVKVRISGKDVYSGEIVDAFTISPIPLGNTNVEVKDYVYNTEEKTPEIIVTYQHPNLNKVITLSEELYEPIFTGLDQAAGSYASVTIIPKNGNKNVSGEKKNVSFRIKAKDLSDDDVNIVLGKDTFEYNGEAHEPEIVVAIGEGINEIYLEDSDYTVAYSNNKNASNLAQVTVNGKGNYTGQKVAYFTIEAVSIENALINVKNNNVDYTGIPITPSFEVTVQGKVLSPNGDYIIEGDRSFTNAGEHTFIVKGTGNYTGTKEGKFTIEKKDVADDDISISLEEKSYTYVGTEIKPSITLVYNRKTFTYDPQNTDSASSREFLEQFTPGYYDNVKVGTATVTITANGDGNFKGVVNTSFTITKKKLVNVTAEAQLKTNYQGGDWTSLENMAFAYEGKAVDPTELYDIRVFSDGIKLEDWEYELSIKAGTNTKPGIGILVISPSEMGNYDGDPAEVPFKITGSLKNTRIAAIEEQVYTGKAIEINNSLVLTYQYPNDEPSTIVVDPKDYRIVYDGEHTDVGEWHFTIEPSNDPNGIFWMTKDTLTGSFEIVPKDISDPEDKSIEVKIPDQIYDGKAVDLKALKEIETMEMTYNGKEISKGEYDFVEMEGEDYTNAKDNIKLLVKINENSKNYEGEREVTFNIKPRSLDNTNTTITVNNNERIVLIGQESIGLATGNEAEGITALSIAAAYKESEQDDALQFTNDELEYDVNIPVGGYTAVGPQQTLSITGKGNFEGTVTTTIDIYGDLAAGVDADWGEGKVTEITYDDKPVFNEGVIEPEVTITYRGVPLKADEFGVVYAGERVKATANLNTEVSGGNEPDVPAGGEPDSPEGEEPDVPEEGEQPEAPKIEIAPTITITAKGYYVGSTDTPQSVVRGYEIQKCNLEEAFKDPATITVSGLDGLIYNRMPQYPQIAMTQKATNLPVTGIPSVDEAGVCENELFEITYENNINGRRKDQDNPPTVIVKAIDSNMNNYTGTAKIAFTIDGIKLNNNNVKWEYTGLVQNGVDMLKVENLGNLEFNGANYYPQMQIYYNSNFNDPNSESLDLKKDGKYPDYTVEYTNNTNAGTARITIEGCNNFSGSVYREFSIKPREINMERVVAGEYKIDIANEHYTGAEVSPADVTVVDYGRKDATTAQAASLYMTYTDARPGVELGLDTDYRVQPAQGEKIDNVNAAEEKAAAKILGINNYSNEAIQSFTIVPLDLSSDVVSIAEIQPQTYQGTQLTPEIRLYVNDKGQQRDVASGNYKVIYGENTNAGEGAGTLIIVPSEDSNNLIEQKIARFDIIPKQLDDSDVTGTNTISYTRDIPNQLLIDGKAEPEVKVYFQTKDGQYDLVLHQDYELEYANNDTYGDASVTVIGIGNFAGGVKDGAIPFRIVRNIADTTAADIPMQPYADGNAVEPKVELTWGEEGRILEEGVDYTLSYRDNIEAGTATVIITGIGDDFGGTKEITFEIGRDFSNVIETSFQESATYTGEEIRILPVTTVKLGDKILAEDTDYTLSYKDNINVGTATVTVTGIGIYEGSKDYTFQILPKPLGSCEISSIADQIYDGNLARPAVSVINPATSDTRAAAATLVEGTDYNVTYLNNEKPGTALVIVSGKGNYTGNQYVNFNIQQVGISGLTAEAISGKRATVSWDASNAVAGYEIWDGTRKIARTNRTSYAFSGLNPKTSYTYRVRTYTIAGGQIFYSEFSEISVETK